jgi:predicted Fe-Mo cluster-binding NifX family protein
MKNERIAVPSEGEGGLNSIRSGHFGHCVVFTLIDLEDGKIKEVKAVPNREHKQGGCLVPVKILSDHKVDILIVGGIGMRPLAGFNDAGIQVYFDNKHPQVNTVVEEFIAGRLLKMSPQQACGGQGGCH